MQTEICSAKLWTNYIYPQPDDQEEEDDEENKFVLPKTWDEYLSEAI